MGQNPAGAGVDARSVMEKLGTGNNVYAASCVECAIACILPWFTLKLDFGGLGSVSASANAFDFGLGVMVFIFALAGAAAPFVAKLVLREPGQRKLVICGMLAMAGLSLLFTIIGIVDNTGEGVSIGIGAILAILGCLGMGAGAYLAAKDEKVL